MNTTMPKEHLENQTLWRISLPSAAIILFAALEVLMKVKDLLYFERWQARHGGLSFNAFINVHLYSFLGKIVYPVALTLYTFASMKTLGLGRLYQIVWGMLGLASLGLRIIEFDVNSIFYYLTIVAYVILLYVLATRSSVVVQGEHV